MKTLTLSNGNTIDFADESHITHLVKYCETFAQIDPIHAAITEENLRGCQFDGQTWTTILPVSCDATVNGDGDIVATFTNREKSDMEIMQDEITELQIAMADIAG